MELFAGTNHLAWKDKPEEAEKWIKSGIAKADRVVYKDGYIPTTVLEVLEMYGTVQGVKNNLGLYAIAELWGYKKSKRTKTKNRQNCRYLTWPTDVKTYRKRKDHRECRTTKDKAYTMYTPNGYILDWLIENYTDKDLTIVANDGMWKLKTSLFCRQKLWI